MRPAEAVALIRAGSEGLLRRIGLFERRCVHCLAPFVPASVEETDGMPLWQRECSQLLCASCRKLVIRREEGFCPYCGEPSPVADAPCMPCEKCLRRLPPWDGFLFLGIYEGCLRDMVLKGKFGGGLPSLEALGRMLGGICREEYEVSQRPDVIIPMPLHRKRLVSRGFSQCVELCRPLARAIGVPVRNDLLFRDGESAPQAMQTKATRLELRQVFRASPEVEGMGILLVDDVVTTGATMTRAVECLKQAGARRVDVLAAARASINAQG